MQALPSASCAVSRSLGLWVRTFCLLHQKAPPSLGSELLLGQGQSVGDSWGPLPNPVTLGSAATGWQGSQPSILDPKSPRPEDTEQLRDLSLPPSQPERKATGPCGDTGAHLSAPDPSAHQCTRGRLALSPPHRQDLNKDTVTVTFPGERLSARG